MAVMKTMGHKEIHLSFGGGVSICERMDAWHSYFENIQCYIYSHLPLYHTYWVNKDELPHIAGTSS